MKARIALKICAAVAGALLACIGCAPATAPANSEPSLAGAWKSSVQFQSGAFAGVRDLTFMYVYDAGGTLIESSNYDSAPPVPPAFGAWRRIDGNRFEARYLFFTTRAATAAEAAAASGGWLPAGHGELTEQITMAPDGQSYEATIRAELFDVDGKAVDGGGEGSVQARRITVTR